MNRQSFNNSLPLWVVLLVLPMLALVAYLHFSQTPIQIAPEVVPNAQVAITPIKSPLSIDTVRSADFESPATTTPDAVTTPTSLDPETARAAVQQVENTVYERATAMFEQEPVDIEWAGAYERSLRDMFAQHHGLQRVSINSISCHTSMCRIEVFTPRDTDADFFTAMFYDGLANFRAGELKAEAAITRRMEQGMTSVYVARKDHTLGFY